MRPRTFLIAALCLLADAVRMDIGPLIAAANGGSADLFVGLLLGLCLGLLVAPAFRAWQVRREWIDASREARLAEQLLERMEADADPDGIAYPAIDGERPVDTNGRAPRPAWRTSH